MTDQLGLNDHMLSQGAQPIDASSIEGSSFRVETLGLNAVRAGFTGVITNSLTVPAGEVGGSTFSTTFNLPYDHTIPEFMVSIYVDNDNNSAYFWPYGSALVATPSLIPMVSVVHDHDTGNFAGGTFVHTIAIHNLSAGARTYYQHVRYLCPIINIETVAGVS